MKADYGLSLHQLYNQQVLANPYPLYHRLRGEDPVHWDPFLHAWIVTRYCDVTTVLQSFSAKCAPSAERLIEMGVTSMQPIGEVLQRQMLFIDPPDHTRLRALCAVAFTPHRVAALHSHIQEIVDDLLEPVLKRGYMDVIAEFADPLSAIVTAEILGLPPSDHRQLKFWSAEFATILGNFQHNSDRLPEMLRNLDEMSSYFRDAIREERRNPKAGLIHALLSAELDGNFLREDDVIANCILVMVGGQETTPNLIGNGVLSLLRNPDQQELLRHTPQLLPSAIEELLRYESPSQHTTRLARSDVTIGHQRVKSGQSVIAVIGAANRDPERFSDPDRLDLTRKDNKHLAFGAGGHFCFGAPLARMEGEIAFATFLRDVPKFAIVGDPPVWRNNTGLRGLSSLLITFGRSWGN